MVYSNIEKSINYKESKNIDRTDLDYESTIYYGELFRKKINYLRIHGAFETFYSVNTGITCISIILLHNSVFPMNSFNRFIFDNTTWGQGFDEWFE